MTRGPGPRVGTNIEKGLKLHLDDGLNGHCIAFGHVFANDFGPAPKGHFGLVAHGNLQLEFAIGPAMQGEQLGHALGIPGRTGSPGESNHEGVGAFV